MIKRRLGSVPDLGFLDHGAVGEQLGLPPSEPKLWPEIVGSSGERESVSSAGER
jgi:hypothetical protein